MHVTGSDGNARIRHKILYWFGLNVPTSSSSSRALALKFAVGVTDGRERERGSQVSGLRVNVCVHVSCVVLGRDRVNADELDRVNVNRIPPRGTHPPLYSPWEVRLH